jgi:alpha-tubulin suppressor-like RCC1 family protein
MTGEFSSATGNVTAGRDSACAVTTNGDPLCWGHNSRGQLGDGTTTDRSNPTSVSNVAGVVQIEAQLTTCAVTTAGAVKCFGDNNYGELGIGTLTSSSPTAVQPTGLGSGVAEIAVGANHVCARKSDGTLWCWGANYAGQLGDGTFMDHLSPVQVTSLGTNVAHVEAGGFHTCVIKTDGTTWCWGYNDYGQVGDGTNTWQGAPVPITTLGTQVVELSGGTYHTCARVADGSVWCWGNNDHGQLGDGSTTSRPTPTLVVIAPVVPASGALSGALLALACAAIAAAGLSRSARRGPISTS